MRTVLFQTVKKVVHCPVSFRLPGTWHGFPVYGYSEVFLFRALKNGDEGPIIEGPLSPPGADETVDTVALRHVDMSIDDLRIVRVVRSEGGIVSGGGDLVFVGPHLSPVDPW